MPSNNSKYTQEIRELTARYILENGKSATSVAEEMGIDTNTVCRWVSDQRIGEGAQEKGKRASGRERGSVLTESAVNVASGRVYYTTASTTVVKGSGGSDGVGGGTWRMMYV